MSDEFHNPIWNWDEDDDDGDDFRWVWRAVTFNILVIAVSFFRMWH